jgi:hypothetical protein
MNLLQLLLLTVAVASTFAKERAIGLLLRSEGQIEGDRQSGNVKGGSKPDGRRRKPKGKKGEKPDGRRREPTGKNGSTSKGSQGPTDCAKLSIRIQTGDVMDNAIDMENGYATKFAVYAVGSRAVIGAWYEQASYVNKGLTDGVGTGLIVWSGGESSISFSGVL